MPKIKRQLYEKWLWAEDVDRTTVVKSGYPNGREWYVQKPGQETEPFKDFKAAIAYATDADR